MSAPFAHAAAQAAAETAAKVLTPVERLELSRTRMRGFLEKKKPSTGTSGSSAAFGAGSIGAKFSDWTEGLRANPLTGAVVDAVRNWWNTHPLRTVVLLAGDSVEEVAVPWIRQYPLAVVAGALATGVIAARIKPWRWIGKPALFAGLASQVASQLMTHAPLEFLIDVFTKFAKPKPPTAAPMASNDPMTDEGFSDTFPGVDPMSSVMAPVPESSMPVASERRTEGVI